jgi:F0F1-type ATP synthase beta subunit
MILDGELDEVPERMFYMTGTIDQVFETYHQHQEEEQPEEIQAKVAP